MQSVIGDRVCLGSRGVEDERGKSLNLGRGVVLGGVHLGDHHVRVVGELGAQSVVLRVRTKRGARAHAHTLVSTIKWLSDRRTLSGEKERKKKKKKNKKSGCDRPWPLAKGQRRRTGKPSNVQ